MEFEKFKEANKIEMQELEGKQKEFTSGLDKLKFECNKSKEMYELLI